MSYLLVFVKVSTISWFYFSILIAKALTNGRSSEHSPLRSSLPDALEIDFKNGLVGLEHHSSVHLIVLFDVQPGSVRAWLAVDTIGEDPRLLLRREEDARLALRE